MGFFDSGFWNSILEFLPLPLSGQGLVLDGVVGNWILEGCLSLRGFVPNRMGQGTDADRTRTPRTEVLAPQVIHAVDARVFSRRRGQGRQKTYVALNDHER